MAGRTGEADPVERLAGRGVGPHRPGRRVGEGKASGEPDRERDAVPRFALIRDKAVAVQEGLIAEETRGADAQLRLFERDEPAVRHEQRLRALADMVEQGAFLVAPVLVQPHHRADRTIGRHAEPQLRIDHRGADRAGQSAEERQREEKAFRAAHHTPPRWLAAWSRADGGLAKTA